MGGGEETWSLFKLGEEVGVHTPAHEQVPCVVTPGAAV